MVRKSLGLALGLALAFAPVPQALAEQTLRLDGSVDSEVYSEVFLSANTYLIRDRDYDPAEPNRGLFTTWLYDPDARNLFQLRARYCLPYPMSSAIESARLVGFDLMDGDQVLLALERPLGAIPATPRTVRSGYYSPGQRYIDHVPVFTRFGVTYRTVWREGPPVYHPPIACLNGSAGFDLAPISNDLVKLPERTLKVRLRFDNGETSGWQLGGGTVRELKRLVAIRDSLASNK